MGIDLGRVCRSLLRCVSSVSLSVLSKKDPVCLDPGLHGDLGDLGVLNI